MSGLFYNQPDSQEGKYLIQRRDGSIPEWPSFVLGGADPAAPAAIRAYANEVERLGMDPIYVTDLRMLANVFENWYHTHPAGDPDGKRHRKDDPEIIEK